MTKNTKSKKSSPVFLSASQVSHLIGGAVKNLVDIKFHESEEGYRFFLIVDCINPEDCIPVDQEIESDEEYLDILLAHGLPELAEYFEAVVPIRPDGKTFFKGFSTTFINQDNIAAFIKSLWDLETYWDNMDKEIEHERELKIKGKNLVEGNGTLN